MTRAEKSKALAMDILLRCTGYPPSEIMTALTLALAQVTLDACAGDKTIEDHVALHSGTLRTTLAWMMDQPPAAGRLQ